MILVIGNKRYSSWSLRPWLLMKHFEIPFQEQLIALDQPETNASILQHSPSGKVPALKDADIIIWDSMAIAEYLNEKFPAKQMWPKNLSDRALARSISNEMHSGFTSLRTLMPHDLQKELKNFDASKAQADIDRIQQIWNQCLQKSGGPFLFGDFSIADAMYAPVVNRFVSYGVNSNAVISRYVQAIRSEPAHQQWIESGRNESLRMPRYDV